MEPEANNTADERSFPMHELRHIIAAGQVSESAIQAMTGIRADKLRSFLGTQPATTGLTAERQALSADETARVSLLAVQLTEGLRIADDERLTAIFEALTTECRLTVGNLSHLTGADVDDLEGVLRDAGSVPVDKKYRLAVTGSYLIAAVNRARSQ